MNSKKIIALVLSVVIILTASPINIFIDIFAGTSPYDHLLYGKGTYSDPADYRKIHADFFEKEGAAVPFAKFSIINKADNSVIGTSSDEDEIVIVEKIPVGTTVKIENQSTVGSGGYIDRIDFQVTKDNSQVSTIQEKPDALNGFELTLDETGTYKFYLCVRDNTDKTMTDGWGNWSYNGAQKAKGLNLGKNGIKETSGTPETAGGDDFWGYWYFTVVHVEVVNNPPKADFTISYKGNDVTDNKTSPATIDSDDKSLVLEDRSVPFSSAEPIVSRKWYYWNVEIGWTEIRGSENETVVYIDDMDASLPKTGINKAFRLVCESETGGTDYAEHTAYFKKAPPPPPPPGKADIFVYYRDKNTGVDVAPPDETTYRGVSYGTYTITAPTINGYTLDESTPSPQVVTVDAANNFKTVTFYYNKQEGSDNKPPVAVITGPKKELAGANCRFDGRSSYDSDGTIEQYIWEYPGATLAQQGNGYIIVWYPYDGNYIRTETVKLTVVDDKGATDTTEFDIEVYPPVPEAKLTVTGIFKENRKVTLDASESYSPSRYPINSYIWTINNSQNVKSLVPLNGNPKNDVIYKAAGTYNNKIEVTNTVGLTDDETKSITIVPDQNPLANFAVTTKLLREPSDNNNASITISNLSTSPDGDTIKKTVMFYAYDSDNDGNFDEETWKYSADGTTWQNVGLPYSQIRTQFDIYNIPGGNPLIFSIKTNQVGKYKFEAMVIEDIPAADTIPELLTPSDYRRGDTFTTKPDSQKIVDVFNTAPTFSFEVKKKKEVDILIATDYTGQKLADLQAALNVQKAALLAKNIDVKYTLVNTPTPVAHVDDSKYWYRRYATYGFVADYENFGSGSDKFDTYFTENAVWEEQQVLESEIGYLPARIPTNITWSKSGLIFEEDESGEKQWEKTYYNVTIRAQNDIRGSIVIPFNTYYRGGMASDITHGYRYTNIHDERVYLDSAFRKEEKIEDITLNINSINFASITSAPLRTKSDRYLLFIGDSSSKVFSGSWGTHFPFGGLTKAEQDYIKANEIKPYIVTPEATLDTTIGAEKAKQVYSGSLTIFKALDDYFYAIADGYPAILGFEADIKEIYGDYILLTNGTLKYRTGGASYATVATNITKCIPIKSGKGDILYGGDMWAITSDGKLRQYKKGIPGYVLNYPDALDVYDISTSYANGSDIYLISCTSGTYLLRAGVSTTVHTSGLVGFLTGQVRDEYGDYWGDGHILVHKDGKVSAMRYVITNMWSQVEDRYVDFLTDIKFGFLRRGVYNEYTEEYDLYNYPTVKAPTVTEWIIGNKLHIMTYGGFSIRFHGNGYESYYIDDPSYNQDAIPAVADVKDGIIKHTDGRITVPFNYTYSWKGPQDRYYSSQELVYLEVPILANKTVKKAIVRPNAVIILTTDGNLYRWLGGTYFMKQPAASELVFVASDVKDVYRNTFNANVNWNTVEQNYYYYYDNATKQLKNLLDNSVIYDDVVDVKISDINQNIYVVTGNGKLYGQGYFGETYGPQYTPIGTLFHELIKTKIIIDDPTRQYITLRSILDNIPDTKYFAAGQYQQALTDITNIYLNDVSFTTNYILVNDVVDYKTVYNDYENDSKYAEQWTYDHDPYYFDNSMGLASFHGKVLTAPVTKFDKKGRYIINAKARDNPKDDDRFNNYRLWSADNQNVILYVHEKPIALQRITVTNNGNGTYTIKAFDAGSYDPDHSMSRSDKGIAAREWRWKESTEAGWHAGQMNKTDCRPDKAYITQLRVKDVEGAWSEWNTITIDKDNPPIALFTVEKSLISTTENLKVKDQSYPQSFSTITKWHWIVKKLNSDGSVPSTNIQNAQFSNSNTGTGSMEGFDTNVKYSYSSPGIYRIYLRVKDSNGLWSDGGTDSTTPADLSKYYSLDFEVINPNVAPAVSITKSPSFVYSGDNVTVSITPTDPDGDLLDIVLQESRDGVNYNTVYTVNDSPSGTVRRFTKNNVSVGRYYYRVAVTDPYGLTAEASLHFDAHLLGITGYVNHTDLWDQHRIDYNMAKSGSSDSPRPYSVFFPGERFMLAADITEIDSQSSVYADSVSCSIVGTSYSDTLSSSGPNSWEGSIWDEDMIYWSNQPLDFRFTVVYRNSADPTFYVEKVYVVRVDIVDDEFWRQHLRF